MRTYPLSHAGRRDREATDKVGSLDGHLSGYRPRPLDLDNALGALPRFDIGDPTDVIEHSDATSLEAPVPFPFGRVLICDEFVPLWVGEVAKASFDCGTQLRMIVLDRENVVGLGFHNRLSNGLLAAHGVDRDRRPFDVYRLEQLRNRSDLVRLVVDRDLPEGQAQFTDPRAHDVKRALAPAPVKRATHGLSVDSDHFAREIGNEIANYERHAVAEFLRVDGLQDPSKRVLRRSPVREREERTQPGKASAGKQLHVVPPGRPVYDCQQADDQDVDQAVKARPIHARVSNGRKSFDEACREHRRTPSYLREIGQIRCGGPDLAAPGGDVCAMSLLDQVDLLRELVAQASGQESCAVVLAFAASNDDLSPLEIDVFHAQRQALREPQAAAIHEPAHQAKRRSERREDSEHVAARQHRGQVYRSLRPVEAREVADLDLEDTLVEEDDSAQRLVLCRRGDAPFDGEVVKEGGQLFRLHHTRVLAAMEPKHLANPVEVGALVNHLSAEKFGLGKGTVRCEAATAS